jgi:LacI family transcriptional regulator, galactose operon repressor
LSKKREIDSRPHEKPIDFAEIGLYNWGNSLATINSNVTNLAMKKTGSKDKATLRDVAEKAGVSITSASRVVNRSKHVTPEVAARVTTAARELGYSPDGLARSLRVSKTQTVGLVVPDITNPFFAEVSYAIEQGLAQSHYSCMLCNSGENLEWERQYIQSLLEKRIDGLILISCDVDARHIEHTSRAAGLPTVLVDRLTSLELDSVRINNRAGAIHAVSYLISKGHRRISMVSGPTELLPGRERLEGFKEGLNLCGLPVQDLCIKISDFSVRGGYEATKALLQERPLPDAIFAGNNQMGVGAFRALKTSGVAVPKDIALLMFDDVPLADVSSPSITVIAQSAAEIGRVAVQMLMERIDNIDAYLEGREILLSPVLIARETA